MSTKPTIGQPDALSTYRQYIVVLQGDDCRRAFYCIYAASADRAKELACHVAVAPPGAVLNVRLGDFEEACRFVRSNGHSS